MITPIADAGAGRLTERQEAILEFIRERLSKDQSAPTLMEIGQRFRIHNPNGVRSHVLALEKKGFIKRAADKARGIQVLCPPPSLIGRLVTSAKLKRWEKEACYYYLPLYVSLKTYMGLPLFTGAYARELDKRVREIVSNHKWDIQQLSINPDGLTVSLLVSPDHSIERVVRNLKNSILTLRLRHPLTFHTRHIWAPGFAASSDRLLFQDLAARHADVVRGTHSREKTVK